MTSLPSHPLSVYFTREVVISSNYITTNLSSGLFTRKTVYELEERWSTTAKQRRGKKKKKKGKENKLEKERKKRRQRSPVRTTNDCVSVTAEEKQLTLKSDEYCRVSKKN